MRVKVVDLFRPGAVVVVARLAARGSPPVNAKFIRYEIPDNGRFRAEHQPHTLSESAALIAGIAFVPAQQTARRPDCEATERPLVPVEGIADQARTLYRKG